MAQGWSVRLAVGDAEGGPLSTAFEAAVRPELRQMAISGRRRDDDDDGPAWVTFELEALSAKEARITAQHLLGLMRQAAGVPVSGQAPVLWVVPVRSEYKSGLRFIEQARDLLEADEPDLAVVAAQIHLELQVATIVARKTASDESPVARVVLDNKRNWAPHRADARPIVDAILGIPVTSFPRWADYMAHVGRRNAVVHEGQEIDADAAAQSIEVVRELWLWLTERATLD
jgi:hypothetical protein